MIQKFLGFPDIDFVFWTLAVKLSFYAIMLMIFCINKLEKIENILVGWLLISVSAFVFGEFYDSKAIGIIGDLLILKFIPYFGAGIVFLPDLQPVHECQTGCNLGILLGNNLCDR